MKKICLLLIWLFMLSDQVNAQIDSELKNRHSFLFNYHPQGRWKYGTPAGHIEIGYEFRFGNRGSWSLKTGFHPYFSKPFGSEFFTHVPFMLNKMFFSRHEGQLEIGAGMSPRFEIFEGKLYRDNFIIFSMMYRRYFGDRWILRGGFYHLIYGDTMVAFNMGLGYQF